MTISGVNQSAQKESNLSLLIRLIRESTDGNECTRVRLAQETGLTQAAVGKLTSELMDWGLVLECASIGNGVGRRPTVLKLNSSPYRCLAIRINRDYISAAVFDIAGKLYNRQYYAISPLEGARHSMQRVFQLAEEILEASDIRPMCIGVAVPGPYNYLTGRISLMSGFPGWDRIDIAAELETRFHLPVAVEQDANCGALAEARHGGYPRDSNMLYVVADRGIGAGLIINGELYRGNLGFAGEIGHASINAFGPKCECGNIGCLELYGSTVAMHNKYIQRLIRDHQSISTDPKISVQQILHSAKNGDPLAVDVYSETVSYLAFGTVNMINAFNPKYIVFADKITENEELFLPVVKDVLRNHLMKEVYDSLEIGVTRIEGDPMLFGACVVAFDSLIQTPARYFKKR